MPISDLHAAAVVAAGYLDGVAVAGKVLRGATFKRTVTRQGFVDGVKTEISAEISVTQLSILDEATGDLKIINSEDHGEEFDAFIIGNVRVLVDTIKRLFPASLHRRRSSPPGRRRWRRSRGRAPCGAMQNGMFLPQARVAAALLTYWRKVGKIGAIVGEMSTGKTVQSLAAGAVWAAQQRSPKLVDRAARQGRPGHQVEGGSADRPALLRPARPAGHLCQDRQRSPAGDGCGGLGADPAQGDHGQALLRLAGCHGRPPPLRLGQPQRLGTQAQRRVLGAALTSVDAARRSCSAKRDGRWNVHPR